MPVRRAVGRGAVNRRAIGMSNAGMSVAVCKAVAGRLLRGQIDVAALDEATGWGVFRRNGLATLRPSATGRLDEAGVFWFSARACQRSLLVPRPSHCAVTGSSGTYLGV